MRRIDTSERRARIAARHRLATHARAADPETAAEAVVGLHASDPMTVYLAARARTRNLPPDALATALYERRSLLRIVGMRTTMFVVPHELAAVIQAACTRAMGERERVRLIRWLADEGIGDRDGAWLADVEADTVAALARLGEATATELVAAVPALGTQISFGEGSRWAGTVGVSTRILFLLAAEGRVLRGRPTGTMVSSRYRWVALDRWLPGGLPALDEDGARAELVRRYLAAYGPVTLADIRWWTGWALRDVRRALAPLPTEEVDLAGAVGLVLAGDDGPGSEDSAGGAGPVPGDPGCGAGRAAGAAGGGAGLVSGAAGGDAGLVSGAAGGGAGLVSGVAGGGARGAPCEPWVALLPSLDPTVMGWAGRDWYLGPHRAALFDRNGNAGPTAWVDGRVVGGWAQRRDGQVVLRLLEDPGREATAALQAEAAAVADWLGPVRVIPRFRTPLETELAAGD